ncbi:MAG TPA: aldehyde dehydrogenase [Solirubrobacteraceae bacterium]|nr:aldehyde dehydrogenase [Solirubrobacteraceae bacterium]
MGQHVPGAKIPHSEQIFIGGEWIAPSSSKRIDVINPATEEPVLQVAEALEADVDRAVTAARAAFDQGPWPRLGHAERAEILRGFACGVRSRRDQFAALQSTQMGLVYKEALGAAGWSADLFDYYADLAADFPFIERHTTSGGGNLGLLVREPVGVVGAIIPWNSPLTLMAPKLAPALLAGCTVVLKPSPVTPGEAYLLAEIAHEIGLPSGVLNVVTAARGVSECLVRDPRIDKISFTGGTEVGRKIASILGHRVARYSLELGGKSAALILDDYDVGKAATVLAASGVRMTGQVCAGLTRIIVPRRRHDDFVDALSQAIAAVSVGDPFDPAVTMGPLATEGHRRRVEGYIAIGKRESRLAAGGGRPEKLERGWYVEPTVFANVDNSATIAQEEIFGPVLSVIPADDERQAVDIANDSIFGLNATVFSNDIDRVYAAARRLRCGTVGHNAFRGDFEIAFGGFKQSGIGREGGREGIYPYVEAKTIVLDEEPQALAADESGTTEGTH